jgi:hypothetical protein
MIGSWSRSPRSKARLEAAMLSSSQSAAPCWAPCSSTEKSSPRNSLFQSAPSSTDAPPRPRASSTPARHPREHRQSAVSSMRSSRIARMIGRCPVSRRLARAMSFSVSAPGAPALRGLPQRRTHACPGSPPRRRELPGGSRAPCAGGRQHPGIFAAPRDEMTILPLSQQTARSDNDLSGRRHEARHECLDATSNHDPRARIAARSMGSDALTPARNETESLKPARIIHSHIDVAAASWFPLGSGADIVAE